MPMTDLLVIALSWAILCAALCRHDKGLSYAFDQPALAYPPKPIPHSFTAVNTATVMVLLAGIAAQPSGLIRRQLGNSFGDFFDFHGAQHTTSGLCSSTDQTVRTARHVRFSPRKRTWFVTIVTSARSY
jgi:hypothetical protein